MATFFGEILPLTSRAVDDDDEDDDVTAVSQSQPVIRWSDSISPEAEKLASSKVPCTLLLIAVGTEANAFTDIYIRQSDYERIGEVLPSSENADNKPSQAASSEKSCHIYRCRSSSTTILCQCKVNVLPEQSYAWAKLLIDKLDLSSADIVVLASSGMGSYCSDFPFSELETPFLRSLHTEKFTGLPVCKTLEQPNMVTGLPAQLMTLFQVYRHKAVMYISFRGNRYMSVADVQAFYPVLQALPVKGIRTTNKNTEQMLRDVVRLHSSHDMMYM